MEKSQLHLYLRETLPIIMSLASIFLSKSALKMTLKLLYQVLLRIFFHAMFYLRKLKKNAVA